MAFSMASQGPQQVHREDSQNAMLPKVKGSRGIAPWVHIEDAVNASFAAERGGEAQPLVLIHGGNMDRRMWDEQFAAFAKT